MRKPLIAAMAAVLVAMCVSCAVRRPPTAPHRNNTEEHRKAKTVEDCLECHRDSMPHSPDRGDCIKCHRLDFGR